MPTLEPIVNTSPREKAVPEFNEKEVVEIVNKGISSGQVAIPAGGTKLYRHGIYCSTSGASFQFILITNKKEAFTLQTSKKAIKDKDYISSIDLNITKYNFVQYSIYNETLEASDAPSYFKVLQTGLVGDSWTSTGFDINEVTDTVTEL